MKSWLDAISDVQTSLNQITKDQWFSRKYVYHLLIDEFYGLIRQKTNWSNILNNSELIKYKCVEMSNDIKTCDNCIDYGAIKSVEPIVAMNTMKGDGIISVTNKSGSKTYTRLPSLFNLKRSSNTRFSRNGYYVYNQGYIYIGGASPSEVVVWYLSSVEELSRVGTCGFLQSPCSIPTDLITAIKNSILTKGYNMLRIPLDEKPNLDVNDK